MRFNGSINHLLWGHVSSVKGLAFFLRKPTIKIPNSLIGSLAYQVRAKSLAEAILVAKMQGRVASCIRGIHICTIPKCKLDYSFAIVLAADG